MHEVRSYLSTLVGHARKCKLNERPPDLVVSEELVGEALAEADQHLADPFGRVLVLLCHHTSNQVDDREASP